MTAEALGSRCGVISESSSGPGDRAGTALTGRQPMPIGRGMPERLAAFSSLVNDLQREFDLKTLRRAT